MTLPVKPRALQHNTLATQTTQRSLHFVETAGMPLSPVLHQHRSTTASTQNYSPPAQETTQSDGPRIPLHSDQVIYPNLAQRSSLDSAGWSAHRLAQSHANTGTSLISRSPLHVLESMIPCPIGPPQSLSLVCHGTDPPLSVQQSTSAPQQGPPRSVQPSTSAPQQGPSRSVQQSTSTPQQGPPRSVQQSTSAPQQGPSRSVQQSTSTPQQGPPRSVQQSTSTPQQGPPRSVQQSTSTPQQGPSRSVQQSTSTPQQGPSRSVQQSTSTPQQGPPRSVQQSTSTPQQGPPRSVQQSTSTPQQGPSRSVQQSTSTPQQGPPRSVQQSTSTPQQGPPRSVQQSTSTPQQGPPRSVQQSTSTPQQGPPRSVQQSTSTPQQGPSRSVQQSTSTPQQGPPRSVQQSTSTPQQGPPRSVQQSTSAPQQGPPRAGVQIGIYPTVRLISRQVVENDLNSNGRRHSQPIERRSLGPIHQPQARQLVPQQSAPVPLTASQLSERRASPCPNGNVVLQQPWLSTHYSPPAPPVQKLSVQELPQSTLIRAQQTRRVTFPASCVMPPFHGGVDIGSQVAPASPLLGVEHPEILRALCCICTERPSVILLLPCRHVCLCEECLARLQRQRCPYCNQNFAASWRVYIP